jgi:hypothetical protein
VPQATLTGGRRTSSTREPLGSTLFNLHTKADTRRACLLVLSSFQRTRDRPPCGVQLVRPASVSRLQANPLRVLATNHPVNPKQPLLRPENDRQKGASKASPASQAGDASIARQASPGHEAPDPRGDAGTARVSRSQAAKPGQPPCGLHPGSVPKPHPG